ncbi:MAG: septal ring lytic transglycosylase RlpA family protein [Beijerinckiaceae bacterium]|nr:septal ring lytic transglycosylase RlpA family protein [Beijerinckiaceae bacterium]
MKRFLEPASLSFEDGAARLVLSCAGSVRLSHGLACIALGLLAAGCSGGPQQVSRRGSSEVGAFPQKKYGPASPRVVADGEAVPKGGGRYQVGRSYSVAGRTYVPREMNGNYSAIGLASWYGEAFHGRRTANGEIYDSQSITAAHPTMPLPSYARVTNLTNGRSMIVRVNDRGPFHGNRVMDVSQRVAEALDFRRLGTARIKVEHMAPAGLAGSDDKKLLASLTIDGKPASLPGLDTQAQVQVASAEPAFTSIPAPRAVVPVSRPAAPVLASRPSEPETAAAGEEDPTYQAVADQPEAVAESQGVQPAPQTIQVAAIAQQSRSLLPERSVPLPPERPFDFSGSAAGQRLSASDVPRAGVQVASSRLSAVELPARRLSPSSPLTKVSYFAPADDVRSTFAGKDPFSGLETQRFSPPDAGSRKVAVGVFQNVANAQRIVASLGPALHARMETVEIAGRVAYKVSAGPFATSEDAERAATKAKSAGASDARIVR